MSSLARRSLRATVAVAGITAAGIGLAGPVLAAPAAPERPSTDDAVPAPDAGSTPNVLGGLRPGAPKAPQVTELPQLFTIQDTGVNTSNRSLPELPTDQLPDPGDAISFGDSEQTRATDVEFQASGPQERDSAMQELDAASMFGDLPTTQLLGATEGNDVRA